MKLPEEFDDEPKMSISAVYSILGVSLFVVAILVLVLVLNQKQEGKAKTKSSTPIIQDVIVDDKKENSISDFGNNGKALTPDDLDFWDMYPKEEVTLEVPKEQPKQEIVADPSTDGKHTLITYASGKEEWALISPYLPKHEYDFTKLVCQNELMKYYENGKQTSYVGVDLSKYNDYVDFVKVKKAGINFVMLRVGARGYGSGQILLDDYFLDNIKRATDAGLEVGVYFFSQAITEDEAKEEANIVINNMADYNVRYPVAFDMESIENDTARIDSLSKEERTTIAKAFLNTVKNAGYKTMIYGNKEWLLKMVDLSKLGDYDIWLSQIADIPDYPYKFTMWQYSTTGTVDGIAGYTDLNISFIDYTEK